MMHEQTRRDRTFALPRSAAGQKRTVERIYERSIRLTAAMDAERHIILAIAFAHVLELPLPKFTHALRKFKARATP
jgi:hypothetical protein